MRLDPGKKRQTSLKQCHEQLSFSNLHLHNTILINLTTACKINIKDDAISLGLMYGFQHENISPPNLVINKYNFRAVPTKGTDRGFGCLSEHETSLTRMLLNFFYESKMSKNHSIQVP